MCSCGTWDLLAWQRGTCLLGNVGLVGLETWDLLAWQRGTCWLGNVGLVGLATWDFLTCQTSIVIRSPFSVHLRGDTPKPFLPSDEI